MTWNDIKDALPVIVAIVVLSGVLYLFYAKAGFRKILTIALSWTPTIFQYLANSTPDKPKVFDRHDMYALVATVSKKLSRIVSDPANTKFEDVEDDLAKLIEEELKIYRDAGVQGVPDLNSDAVKEQTGIIFSIVKRLGSEDTSGDDRTNKTNS